MKGQALRIRSLFIFSIFLTLWLPCGAGENSPPADVPDPAKTSSWLQRMNPSYEKSFVQRKDVHIRDPYVWAYSEDFAKDFGMPDRWVAKDLKGADALAFRIGNSFPLCGWNGKPEACNVSADCVVEMYFNRHRNPLPWNEKIRWTDLQLDQTSAWILGSLRSFNRPQSAGSATYSPFADPDSGAELAWWYVHLPNSGAGGGALLQSYDRSVFETYSLVTLKTFCSEYAGLELRGYRSAGHGQKVYRTVTFPKDWRERVRPLMSGASKAAGDFFRRKLEELKTNN